MILKSESCHPCQVDADSDEKYGSARDDRDHGTIIDFLQRRQRLNLDAVRQVLRPWIGFRTPLTKLDMPALGGKPNGQQPDLSSNVEIDITLMVSKPLCGVTVTNPAIGALHWCC